MNKVLMDKIHSTIITVIEYNGAFSDSEVLSRIGFDSLLSIRLIVELESLFEITFEEEDLLLDNFSTPMDIYNTVERKLNNLSKD